MILRFVSGSMLQKSNRAGPLAARQKVLLKARFIGCPVFSDFQLPGKRKTFKNFSGIPEKFLGNSGKFPRNFRDYRDPKKSLGFGKFSREIFFELDYFDIFSEV